MLNLTVQQTKLTQGQPPAVMRFKTNDPLPLASTAPVPVRAEKAATETARPAPVAPSVIADKVYELFRRERAVERQRRGLW